MSEIIPKKKIIQSLNNEGFNFIGFNGSELTFEKGIFKIKVNYLEKTYIRYPTKRQIKAKYDTANDLITKIDKFISEHKKQISDEKSVQDSIEDRKNFIYKKMKELTKDTPEIKEVDGEFYYENYVLTPKLNSENTIFFRAIVSGNKFDLNLNQLISLYNTIKNI